MKRLDAWMLEHGAPAIRWALAVMGLAAIVSLLSALAGCSSGPQVPIVTVPMHLSCTWNVDVADAPERDAAVTAPSSTDATAGVVVSDNDCSIDRSAASADPTTTGNEVGPVEVSPDTDVSAIPGGL